MSPLTWRRAVALLTVVLLVGLVSGTAGARAADVHGDDEADRYIGTGGLILPPSVGVDLRTEVARCAGCGWRLSSPCQLVDAGNPFSGTPVCLSVVRGCPAMAELLRAWFRPVDGPWREIGLVCIGIDGPVTVLDVGRRVHDRIVATLPPQRPSRQPARGAVSQLPVVFDSGQSSEGLSGALMLAGQAVTIAAQPAWRWDFGDGAVLATSDPGGAFPDDSVTHPYRAAGTYRVRLTTTWAATFDVDGLGPFPVPGDVSQAVTVAVPVGEGRAVLAVR